MSGLRDILRSANQRRKARRLMKRDPVTTPFGFRFVGTRNMQEGAFEPGMSALLAGLLDDTDLFVNVGANTGYHVCHALTRGVRTVAIEPGPKTFAVLARNIGLNGWGPEVLALPVACGEESGILTLYGEGTGASVVPGWGGNPDAAGHRVSVVPLDRIVRPGDADRITVLMDVEGHELAALKGAGGLVGADPKPVWIVEISLTAHQPDGGSARNPTYVDTLTLFRDAGYGCLVPESPDPDPGWETALAFSKADPVPFSYANFLFCDPARREDILGIVRSADWR